MTLPATAGAGTALYPTTKASGLYPVPQPSRPVKLPAVLVFVCDDRQDSSIA